MKKAVVLLICICVCAALSCAQAESYYAPGMYDAAAGYGAYDMGYGDAEYVQNGAPLYGAGAGYGVYDAGYDPAGYALTGTVSGYGWPAVPAAGYTVPSWFREFTGYVNGYRINVRSCPGTSGTVCGVVSYGDSIHVTNWTYVSGNKLWYYGSIGSLCGWIFSGYVGGVPFTPPAPAAAACALPGGFGTIRLNGTNFRSGPGMGYPSLLQLRQGTAVQLLSAARDAGGTVWYQAIVGGRAGWVRSDLVTAGGTVPYTVPAPCSSAGFTGYTNTNAVNIRVTPNGAVIAQVRRGTAVQVYGTVCQFGVYWYQVSFYGGLGYVRADLVTGGSLPAPGYGAAGPGVNYYDFSNNTTIIGDGAGYGEGYGYTAPQDGYTGQAGYGNASGGYQAPSAGQSGAAAQPFSYPDTGNSTGSSGAPAGAALPPVSLNFVTCNPALGQTLPVYSAPNAESMRADGGTAQVTLSESLYAAGFDGQWLLVMYRNHSGMVRAGYVNAFQLQGELPNVPALTFGAQQVTVTGRTAVTSDPMEQTDTLIMLDSGASVTLLATLKLNGDWVYVETRFSGQLVRGFIPAEAVRSAPGGEELG